VLTLTTICQQGCLKNYLQQLNTIFFFFVILVALNFFFFLVQNAQITQVEFTQGSNARYNFKSKKACLKKKQKTNPLLL
jgi:hypothetical protein